jgi:hypothetical protein
MIEIHVIELGAPPAQVVEKAKVHPLTCMTAGTTIGEVMQLEEIV